MSAIQTVTINHVLTCFTKTCSIDLQIWNVNIAHPRGNVTCFNKTYTKKASASCAWCSIGITESVIHVRKGEMHSFRGVTQYSQLG